MLAAVLATGLLGMSFTFQVPTVKAAAANTEATEIVRLINGARAAAGKKALRIDVYLASKARDGAIPCPDDASKTIPGRARDFADFGKMSHSLRLCDAASYTLSSKLFVTVMQEWGYGSVGEIDLVNGGYGTGKFLYTYGSYSTWTYATTGHAMTGWKTSSSHWNIIMGSYDRVGCGGWVPSGTTFYYDCVFSVGGPSPSGLASAPTASPFSDPVPTTNPPAATRTPVPPAPVKTVSRGSGTANTDPTGTAAPSSTPTLGSTLDPTSAVAGIQSDPTKEPEIPAAAQGGAGAIAGAPSTPVSEGLTRESAIGFAAGASLLVGFWVLLDRIRRRKRTPS